MSDAKQMAFVEIKDGSYKGKKNQSKSKIELSKADSALSVIEEIANDSRACSSDALIFYLKRDFFYSS